MPKNLADLKIYLTRVKAWALVAGVFTLALLVYYSVEGTRYWNAANETASLRVQNVVLTRTLAEKLRGQSSLTADLNVERQEMDRVEGQFHHPLTDELIGIVIDAARKNQVTLSSVSAGNPETVFGWEIQYQNQPMTLVMVGQNQDIYRFFSELHHILPTTGFDSVRIGDSANGLSQANVQLKFLLSPQVVPPEDDKKSKSSSAKNGKSGAVKKAANV